LTKIQDRGVTLWTSQVVNFPVCGGDFPVDAFNLQECRLGGMLLLVQFQHPLNEFHHLVVLRLFAGC
jgi:hypothetical protein